MHKHMPCGWRNEQVESTTRGELEGLNTTVRRRRLHMLTLTTQATSYARCHSNATAAHSFRAPPHLLNASIAHPGAPGALAGVFSRLRSCKGLTAVAIGSSITAKSGGCTNSLISACLLYTSPSPRD